MFPALIGIIVTRVFQAQRIAPLCCLLVRMHWTHNKRNRVGSFHSPLCFVHSFASFGSTDGANCAVMLEVPTSRPIELVWLIAMMATTKMIQEQAKRKLEVFVHNVKRLAAAWLGVHGKVSANERCSFLSVLHSQSSRYLLLLR